MDRARRTDFLFAGVAIAPTTLGLAGHPDAAILVFVPLLLLACLYGAWEEAGARGAAQAPVQSAGRPATGRRR